MKAEWAVGNTSAVTDVDIEAFLTTGASGTAPNENAVFAVVIARQLTAISNSVAGGAIASKISAVGAVEVWVHLTSS